MFLAVSVRLFGAHQGSDGSFHTYSNRTNRAITPEFVLIEPNMTSVNTPLINLN